MLLGEDMWYDSIFNSISEIHCFQIFFIFINLYSKNAFLKYSAEVGADFVQIMPHIISNHHVSSFAVLPFHLTIW